MNERTNEYLTDSNFITRMLYRESYKVTHVFLVICFFFLALTLFSIAFRQLFIKETFDLI